MTLSGDAVLRAEIGGAHAANTCVLPVPGFTCDEAWQILADTDGLNRALGNHDVMLTSVPVEAGVARRMLSTKTTPPVTYEEEHYQWERGHWVGGRRFFEAGDLAKFVFLFAMSPSPEGAVAH